jgi:hypothetical protein
MPGDRDDYRVGYGRPPRQHRFKKGQSGNPKGRPKGSKNTTNILRQVLDEKIIITQAGKPRNISKREALMRRVVHDALSGKHLAQQVVLGLDREVEEQLVKQQEPRVVVILPANGRDKPAEWPQEPVEPTSRFLLEKQKKTS